MTSAAAPARLVEGLTQLHRQRTATDLHRCVRSLLESTRGPSSVAIVLHDGGDGDLEVVCTAGDECPLSVGDRVDATHWPESSATRAALKFGEHVIGELWVAGEGAEALVRASTELLDHYTIALVNLSLNEDTEATASRYFASLQALEQGVILFQETDAEAVSARFLSLMTSLLGCQAGAILLLHEPGDVDSELRCDQTLGIPHEMIAGLRTPDGAWWPQTMLDEPVRLIERESDGSLAGFDPDSVPAVLQNVACVPLRYHGLVAGLAIGFNVLSEEDDVGAKTDSVRHLGELGAAVFHRIKLEETAVRNRAIQTQLEIAAHIQARLIPAGTDAMPAGIDCAWSSKPAQSIGGDYLDVIAEPGVPVRGVIADVSGHGIDSALLMTSFRANWRAKAEHNGPAALLGLLNDEIANETGDTGMFVTFASFRFDPATRELVYASAGHNPLLLYRSATRTLEHLESTGLIGGVMQNVDYDEETVQMEPGDVLVLYTDGLVEAEAKLDQEMFGEQRAETLIREHAGSNARQILDALVGALTEHCGTDRFEDDVSLLVVKCDG